MREVRTNQDANWIQRWLITGRCARIQFSISLPLFPEKFPAARCGSCLTYNVTLASDESLCLLLILERVFNGLELPPQQIPDHGLCGVLCSFTAGCGSGVYGR